MRLDEVPCDTVLRKEIKERVDADLPAPIQVLSWWMGAA